LAFFITPASLTAKTVERQKSKMTLETKFLGTISLIDTQQHDNFATFVVIWVGKHFEISRNKK